MTNRHLKDRLFAHVARLAKAIANPKRLELIELLAQQPKTVEQLASEADISIALTSAHLQALKHANCVFVTQEGKYRRYHLANERISHLWVILHQLATAQLPELAEQLASAAAATPPDIKDVQTLLALAEQGEIQLIDVRPSTEYAYAHLPYAQSIPIVELTHQAHHLVKDKPIVAYCRGPFCLYARDAVHWLNAHGFSATQWKEGMSEYHLMQADKFG
jgi:rhodanese-related sulfurtransferase/DNA-binding transcriptional ArsR family regulator